MDRRSEKRMWRNLAKGAALVVGGFAVVIAIDHVAGAFAAAQADALGREGGEPFMDVYASPGREGFYSAVIEGDFSGLGAQEGVSPDFIAECFSPEMMGEARSTLGGSVVGIVSEADAGELHRLCAEALQAHGWIRVESGEGLRASFVKGTGRYRWLFLGSTPLAGASSAVVVLHGEAA